MPPSGDGTGDLMARAVDPTEQPVTIVFSATFGAVHLAFGTGGASDTTTSVGTTMTMRVCATFS